MSENRFALLIGASEFGPNGPSALSAGESDVVELRDVLCDPRIGAFSKSNVRLTMNAGSDETQRLIGWLCEDRDPDDFLLLYYTGHGLKDHQTGKLYLALQNTAVSKPRTASLSADWLRQEITLSKSNRKLVILDCCHSGLYPGSGVAKAGREKAVSADTFSGQGEGSWTLASSTSEQYSLADNTANKSVFTAALVEALKTGAAAPTEKYLSLSDLAQWLQREVPARAKEFGGLMEPELLGRGKAPLLIAQNPHPVSPIEKSTIEALSADNVLLRRGAIATLAQHLRDTNSPRFEEAKSILEARLLDDGESHFELRQEIAYAVSPFKADGKETDEIRPERTLDLPQDKKPIADEEDSEEYSMIRRGDRFSIFAAFALGFFLSISYTIEIIFSSLGYSAISGAAIFLFSWSMFHMCLKHSRKQTAYRASLAFLFAFLPTKILGVVLVGDVPSLVQLVLYFTVLVAASMFVVYSRSASQSK